jgi:phosphoglycerate dehydrogenase-like enzyme
MAEAPDIAVLRAKPHGLSAADYADVLCERFPDREIALARTPDQERELLGRVRVATGFDIDPDVLAGSSLELFACVYAGTNHLPLSALEANDVAVTNAAGVHAPNVSEHVLGAILSFARRFHWAFRRRERREWRSYQATELQGSTVSVVGLGAIGQAVVERLEPFGVDTVGVRYTPSKGGPTDKVYGFEQIHEAVGNADYVVLACPLTAETEKLIGDDVLSTLPPSAVLVNIARGRVVDTEALVGALQRNAIRGAALDVTDPEPLPADHSLWGMDNVLITPHNAGHTPAYWDRTADILAQNLAIIEKREAFDELENQVV